MSTDFSIRPVGVPVATPIPPSAGGAAQSSVATQLPASQSVTATNASGGVRNDSQNAGSSLSQQAFFDTAAASVVFQSVDDLTGQVVQQYPDDAMLRRRAYFHSLDKDSSGPLATDVTA